MTVNIVFFASLRETLGVKSVDLSIPEPSKVSAVIAQLVAEHSPDWLEILTAENIRIAVNQDMINDDIVVSDGDEVAFFPPVTGG